MWVDGHIHHLSLNKLISYPTKGVRGFQLATRETGSASTPGDMISFWLSPGTWCPAISPQGIHRGDVKGPVVTFFLWRVMGEVGEMGEVGCLWQIEQFNWVVLPEQIKFNMMWTDWSRYPPRVQTSLHLCSSLLTHINSSADGFVHPHPFLWQAHLPRKFLWPAMAWKTSETEHRAFARSSSANSKHEGPLGLGGCKGGRSHSHL